jgi:hypothetical protein
MCTLCSNRIGQQKICTTESSFAVEIQTWSRCTEYSTPNSPARYGPEYWLLIVSHLFLTFDCNEQSNANKGSSHQHCQSITAKYLGEWSSKLGGTTPVFLSRGRIAFVCTNVHHKDHKHLYLYNFMMIMSISPFGHKAVGDLFRRCETNIYI